MSHRCHQTGCTRPVIAHITGPNLPTGGVDVCDQHYDQTFAGAGIPRHAVLIRDEPNNERDDGQGTLFDIDPGGEP